jgi:CHAT domain-containing protein/tetratricopeptide (TPR) repeat protein
MNTVLSPLVGRLLLVLLVLGMVLGLTTTVSARSAKPDISSAPLSKGDSSRAAERIIHSRDIHRGGALQHLTNHPLEMAPLLAAPARQDESPSPCTPAYNEGIALYKQSRYSEALSVLQTALECTRQENDRVGESATRYYIGLVHSELGQYDAAVEHLLQALALTRETGSIELAQAARSGIGIVYLAQARYEEARAIYQQMLTTARELANTTHEVAALNGLAIVYESQGRYAEAAEMLQQALALSREMGDRENEAATLANLGAIYYFQAKYPEALGVLQQALAMHREFGDRPSEANTLNIIGKVYASQSRHTKGLEALQQALAIYREIGYQFGISEVLSNMGELYSNQNRYSEALPHLEQALGVARDIGARRLEGNLLLKIGHVYLAEARYAEALDTYQGALAIHQAIGHRNGEGIALHFMGAVYLEQDRYSEALQHHQQALVIAREIANPAQEATVLHDIGVVHIQQMQYDDALHMLGQALAIARAIGYRDLESSAMIHQGMVQVYQERYQEALETYQQALTIAHTTGSTANEIRIAAHLGFVYQELDRSAEAIATYEQALSSTRQVGSRLEEAIILNNLGELFRQQQQFDRALTSFEQSMDALEAIRATAGSEAGRIGFIGQYTDLYERASILYYGQGRYEQAFLTSERGRARSFLDSLATGHVQLFDDEINALLQREQEGYRVRQAARDALAQARVQSPDNAGLIADLEAQLAAAEAEYAAVMAEIEARGGQLQNLVPGRSQNILGVAEVQALLDEQTTLVSYMLGENASLAFLLTRSSFQVIDLPITRQEATTHVESVIAAASIPDAPAPASLMALHQALITPIAPHLTTPHLAIVPHSSLHYLPFAALTPDGQQFLIDEFTLSVLPSASSLHFIRENVRAQQGAPLILGNPDGSLPFAATEAEQVGTHYGTAPLLGAAATESAVRAQAAQTGILHLAAHGTYNSRNPLYSTIHLAGDDQHDGKLQVHEVYSLNLQQSNLVVLSACETQQGALSDGDDIVGLTRSFFFGGTPTVLASLWRVDDASTARLMERFYIHWQSGLSKAAALRQAQQDVRAEQSSFRYWAAFMLSGDAGLVEAAPGASAPAVAPAQAPEEPGARCFPETGQCITGAIRAYWEANGGLAVFGLPVAPEQTEMLEGRPVVTQWFERNRLELHPENAPPYDVLLGRLGADRLTQQGYDWQAMPREEAQEGCRYFEQTGRNVCEPILTAWRANGLELDGAAGLSEAENLALFGLPLTGLMTEELQDGQTYQVQYFERARFELHPENAPPFNVLLGLLGNEVSSAHANTAAPAAEETTRTPERIDYTGQWYGQMDEDQYIQMHIVGDHIAFMQFAEGKKVYTSSPIPGSAQIVDGHLVYVNDNPQYFVHIEATFESNERVSGTIAVAHEGYERTLAFAATNEAPEPMPTVAPDETDYTGAWRGQTNGDPNHTMFMHVYNNRIMTLGLSFPVKLEGRNGSVGPVERFWIDVLPIEDNTFQYTKSGEVHFRDISLSYNFTVTGTFASDDHVFGTITYAGSDGYEANYTWELKKQD